MQWNVYGKLTHVVKTNGTTIDYSYDATGNRISKTVGGKTKVYVRDASGNVMATYLKDAAINSGNLSTEAFHIYGSSMLGRWKTVVDVESAYVPPATTVFTRGEKEYDFSNHLGNNVLVLNDKKLQHTTDNTTVDWYTADVLNATDYSAYGENLIGREFNGSGIKYGFNGKENDEDLGYQDYGMRLYSVKRRGFESVDPLTKNYPWYTPYQFAGNSSILNIDLDGLERVNTNHVSQITGTSPKLEKSEWYVIEGQVEWKTFGTAAKYNTENNNPGAYQNIEDRHNWYEWAAEQTKSKSNYWYAAAADVTSENMVGAADRINLWFVTDDMEDLLRGANRFLLQENFKNFGKYALGEGPITWKGQSYANLSGAELDNQMVVIEMTNLQGYLDNYKKTYIKNNGQKAWDKMQEKFIDLFGNATLRKRTPESNQYAQQEFEKKYGKDTKFDFMNLEHRVFQGQKMAEFLRKQDEEKTN